MAVSLDESIDASVHRNWLSWLVSQQTFWVSVAAVVAFVVLSFASDVFATQQNLFNVTRNFAFVAIIAIGMTAVIVTGGIDLSVGAVLVLSGMVIGMTMNAGTSIWVAIPLALGVSLLVGALNGVMIAYVGVPPFVVTLGMLSIARSVAMVLSDNRMVYQFGPDQAQLLTLGGGFISVALPFVDAIRVPNPVVFLLILLLIAGFPVSLDAMGAAPFRHRRQRARGDDDRRAGQAASRSASTCSAACAPVSLESSRSAGSAPSPQASVRAWSCPSLPRR